MFTIDPQLLTLVVGTILPLVIAVITKEVTDPSVKAWLLLAASAVTGIAVSAQAAGGLVTADAVYNAIVTFIVGVGAYKGLWKPTGVAPKVAEVTDKKGIGLEVKPKS